MTAEGTKTDIILFEELTYEVSTKMLAMETLERLNLSHTGFDFKGYNVKIPGYICLPVKHSSNPEIKKSQKEELLVLGYEKLDTRLVEEYQLNSEGKDIYVISVEKLLDIHNVEH